MIPVQISKRNVTRTVFVPHYIYGDDTPEELAQAEQRTRSAYRASQFRFYLDCTVWTRGRMRVVFDLAGKAIEGYSYDACLFAFTEPCEDFPQGRLIWNDTQYSITTSSKHRYPLLRFAQGEKTGSRTVSYGDGDILTTSTYAQYDHRCDVIEMPWSCAGSDLRREVHTREYGKRAGERAAAWHECVREMSARKRRDARIARGDHLRLVKGEVA